MIQQKFRGVIPCSPLALRRHGRQGYCPRGARLGQLGPGMGRLSRTIGRRRTLRGADGPPGRLGPDRRPAEAQPALAAGHPPPAGHVGGAAVAVRRRRAPGPGRPSPAGGRPVRAAATAAGRRRPPAAGPAARARHRRWGRRSRPGRRPASATARRWSACADQQRAPRHGRRCRPAAAAARPAPGCAGSGGRRCEGSTHGVEAQLARTAPRCRPGAGPAAAGEATGRGRRGPSAPAPRSRLSSTVSARSSAVWPVRRPPAGRAGQPGRPGPRLEVGAGRRPAPPGREAGAEAVRPRRPPRRPRPRSRGAGRGRRARRCTSQPAATASTRRARESGAAGDGAGQRGAGRRTGNGPAGAHQASAPSAGRLRSGPPRVRARRPGRSTAAGLADLGAGWAATRARCHTRSNSRGPPAASTATMKRSPSRVLVHLGLEADQALDERAEAAGRLAPGAAAPARSARRWAPGRLPARFMVTSPWPSSRDMSPPMRSRARPAARGWRARRRGRPGRAGLLARARARPRRLQRVDQVARRRGRRSRAGRATRREEVGAAATARR